VNNRKSDSLPVTAESLAKSRDEVADAWAAEYAREDSPWHAETMLARELGQ
jgi:hypothetical protein